MTGDPLGNVTTAPASVSGVAALEAENKRLRKGLRLIIERSPGQAHRIAIQMLDRAETVKP